MTAPAILAAGDYWVGFQPDSIVRIGNDGIFDNNFNPEYALDNLLQLEMPAKYEASQVLLNHHSG